MTDDARTPLSELASAAFDNEISAVERAQVEASATLAGEVASYAMLRARLADVQVPAQARDHAVAAALAVFDEAAAHASEPSAAAAAGTLANTLADTSSKVVWLKARRQRQQRWLTAAAAAAVVVVVAAGVINASGSDNKSASKSLGTSAQDSQVNGAAPTKIAATASDSAAGSANTSVGAPTAGGAEITSVNGPAVVSPWALAPNFGTAQEIAAYALESSFGQQTRVSASPSAAVPDTSASASTKSQTAADRSTEFNTTCLTGVTSPIAAIVFQGRQVLAIRDDNAKVVRVIDPSTCAVLITVSLG